MRTSAVMGMKTSLSAILLLHLSYVFGYGYDTGDFDGWYQPIPHEPVDIITDVVNDMGVRILQQYPAHGNVAFSPMGVGFVLAALYEGSNGRSSHQISEALGLPRDRDITRIGFRDIHRRLRMYLNADGFLGGLTLNQENTRLRTEYEEVLRFYGFDLSMDEETNDTSSAPDAPPSSEPSEESITESDATSDTDGTTTPSTTAQLIDAQSTSSGTEVPATLPTSTTSPVEMLGMTLNTVNMQDRLTQTTTTFASTAITVDTTVNSQSLPNENAQTTIEQDTVLASESSSAIPGTLSTTTPVTNFSSDAPTIDTVPVSTTVAPATMTTGDSTSTTAPASTSSQNINTVEPSTTTTTISIESMTMADSMATDTVQTSDSTTFASVEITSGTESMTTSDITSTDGQVEVTTTNIEEPNAILSLDLASINVTQSTMTLVVDNSTDVTTTEPPVDMITVATDLTVNETISAPSTTEMGSSDLPSTNIATDNPTTVGNMQNTDTSTPSSTNDVTNSIRRRRSPRGYFSSYPDEGIWMQDLGIWKPYIPSMSEASVRDSTEISFLVNGCDVSSISASRYVAVLPFAYFPSLHAVAVEFPLDDPRYNILLLMSTNRRDTYRLARDLGGKSLRLLRKQLQPTWVRATIPSFMLRGFVTLTSFLQRLGIADVFEPRAADLSPMTPDLGTYVRDVQQSIGVNIRNYMKPDRTHSRNGLFERAGPVPFTVVQPFLYFIVDVETSVALIAGRVNDPLNSRIL